MSDRDPNRERAERLVAWHDKHRRNLIALATAVAPAVRVEPGLLRTARLALRPPVSVAIETDLWFSPLVESYSLRGLVLDGGVVAILRERLARNRDRLDAAYARIHELHKHAAPTIVLEEDLIYAALTKDATKVHTLLGDVLRTLADQPDRAAGIAHWADRALPAMPQLVRDDAAASELMAIVERTLEAPVIVGVQLTTRGIEVSEPPTGGAPVLEIPASPLRLEARPTHDPDNRLVIDISRGRTTPYKLPRAADGVTIVTADGRTALLTPARARAQEPAATAGTGGKRLVVCCDGTWNRADQMSPTNVSKLFRAISTEANDRHAQLTHYEPGAGTRPLQRVLAGGLGVGLSRSVMECYRFLVDRYEPGDDLFLIGGSRGAVAVRSLAGLVRNSGILRREHMDRVRDAYNLYRSRSPDTAPWGAGAERFRSSFSHPETDIRFVGVWDAVGPLGVRPGVMTRRYAFHDMTLSSSVRNAYHAVAIDERRRAFEPALWVAKHGSDGKRLEAVEGQTCVQAWFAGVHSDVVGGYPDTTLSEIPLLWMAQKARECGLVLRPDHLVVTARPDPAKRAQGIEVEPDPLGLQHESMSGFYRLLGPRDRRLSAVESEALGSAVASSAVTRYERDSAYRPRGLEEWLSRGGVVEGVDLMSSTAKRA